MTARKCGTNRLCAEGARLNDASNHALSAKQAARLEATRNDTPANQRAATAAVDVHFAALAACQGHFFLCRNSKPKTKGDKS